jgi:hypothetical protein
MCTADTGILTHHWLKDYPRPYANFNVWKVCRNWDTVQNWAVNHQTQDPPQNWFDMMVPGSVLWDEPPQPEDFTVPASLI